jgi:hypothetical protein
LAIDLNHQIFASSSGADSWFNAKGNAKVLLRTELRRGFNLELNAEAVAQINVILKKWAELSIFAEVKARLQIQGQLQTPLDLFEEAGLAVRLQAIAELAVGVGISFGMTVGDLVKNLGLNTGSQDIDKLLQSLMLEEISLEAVLYGQFAIAVMAYANLVLTGTLHPTAEQPQVGFQFIFDAGMGFIAGGGYRFFLHAGIQDPRRLVGRASGMLAYEIGRGSGFDSNITGLLPFLRMGIRVSYEIGEYLTQNNTVSVDEVSKVYIQVLVQELQYYLFMLIGAYARTELIAIITNSPLPESQAPVLLKQLNQEDAWTVPSNSSTFFQLADEISSKIPEGVQQDSYKKALSSYWATSQLFGLLEGSPELPLYNGAISASPLPSVKAWINQTLGREPDITLNQEDVVKFIISSAVPSIRSEKLEPFMDLLSPQFGASPQETVKWLLNISPASGYQQLLNTVSIPLQSYMDRKLSASNIQAMEAKLPAGTGRNMFKQVLIPALEISTGVLLPEIESGLTAGMGKKEVKEALSASLITLIGRSLIPLVQEIMREVNKNVQGLLSNTASKIKELGVISKLKGLNEIAEVLEKPLQEGVKLSADLIAPLPPDLFEDLFYSILDVLTPIGNNDVIAFSEHLNRPNWIPRINEIESMSTELSNHLATKATTFAVKIIPSLFQALIDDLLRQIEKFIAYLQETFNRLVQLIVDRIKDELIERLTRLYLEEARLLLSFIPSKQIRDKVNDALESAVNKVVKELILGQVLDSLMSVQIDESKLIKLVREGNALTVDFLQNYIINEIQEQLDKKIGLKNFSFKLTVPISFKIDLSPFPPIEHKQDVSLGLLSQPGTQIAKIVMEVISGINIRSELSDLIYYINAAVMSVINLQLKIETLQNDMAEALVKYG